MEKALADLDEALRRVGDDPADRASILVFRGSALRELDELDRAIADWEECERLRGRTPLSRLNLSEARADKGDLAGAIAIFTEAIKSAKGPGVLQSRARLLREAGRLDEALADIEEYMRLMPEKYRDKTDRARIRAARGEYPEAMADFEDALRSGGVGPGAPYVAADFAFFLATCPDPKYRDGARALKLAEQADPASIPRRGGRSFLLDARAAALAELGDFKQAASLEEQALSLLTKVDRHRAALEARLALYRDKKPFRDIPKAP